MKKSRFYSGLLTMVIVTGLVFGAYSAFSEYVEYKEEKNADKILKQFSEACLEKFPAKTNSDKIKNLRHCVFINTKFSTDKSMTPFWNDQDLMASWIFDYASETRPDPPPMECSNRSGTLKQMYEALGYEAHDFVLARDEDNFNDHVVVEVLNPDTKEWEVQGPSYDVEYVSLKDRRKLGVQEMLSLGTTGYEPCNFEGKCGWDLKTKEGFDLQYNRGYWNTAWIKEKKTLYVSKTFDENKKRPVYGQNLSYCEWRAKWCKKVVHIE